jgi:hypothetical protein
MGNAISGAEPTSGIAFSADGSAVFSATRSQLDVWQWEPLLLQHSVSAPWLFVNDFLVGSDRLLAVECQKSVVSILSAKFGDNPRVSASAVRTDEKRSSKPIPQFDKIYVDQRISTSVKPEEENQTMSNILPDRSEGSLQTTLSRAGTNGEKEISRGESAPPVPQPSHEAEHISPQLATHVEQEIDESDNAMKRSIRVGGSTGLDVSQIVEVRA